MADNKPTLAEVATTRDGRDITRGIVPAGMAMMPEDAVLRGRGLGYEAYQEVLRDDQVAATFQQRRMALTGTEYRVVPGGEDRLSKRAAKEVAAMLAGMDFDAVTDRMLYGLFYGYAVGECLWERVGELVALQRIKVRRQRRFGFAADGSLRLLTHAAPLGEVVPERKFWVFSVGAEHDDEPYGLGLAHWLYWPVYLKRNGMKAWMAFLDKFGSPTALGTFPASAGEAEKRRLLQALQALRSDSGVIIPEGMAISLLEAGRQGSADHVNLVSLMNRAISKVVLSQTMTSEAEGGQYKAEVQDGVRRELVRADANLVAGSFNRSVAVWLTAWNWPGALPPRLEFDTGEPEDLDRRAAREKVISEMTGLRPTRAHVEKVYGGEWEDSKAATATPQSGAAFAEDGEDGEDGQEAMDAVDLAGVMEPLVREMLQPLLDALREGVPPDEVMLRLGEALPSMDSRGLDALMARLMFVAETWGRLQDGH